MEFAAVSNVTGFFKDEAGGKWVMKVKQLYDNIKILFKINTLPLEIAKGEEVYKFTIITQDYKKIPLGWIVYYPTQKILEVFEGDNLLFRFKGKQVISKGIGPILDKAGADSLFKRLTNLL